MINLNNLKKLKAAEIKTVLKKKGSKKVYIQSNHGYWRKDAKGHTDKVEEAWVLPLSEAYEHTKHCGHEKQILFHYVIDEPAIERHVLNCEEPVTIKTTKGVNLAEFGD